MKKASQIFEVMREYLHSKEFFSACQISPVDFIRERNLSHKTIFLFILNLLKTSIPKELISFCNFCELDKVTRSAITQSRAKLSPLAFKELNYVLLKEYYNDNQFHTWENFIRLALDGSTVELPIDSPSIIEKYGYTSNQTDKKVPLARISKLYDTLNGITLDTIIAPFTTSERVLAIQHIENIKSKGIIDLKKTLIIFDRGYPSVALMVYLMKNEIHFIIRCGSQFLKEVGDVVKNGKNDVIINMSLKKSTRAAKRDLKSLFSYFDFNEIISFRTVVDKLNTGEDEVLLTSLTCKIEYPRTIFIDVYFSRWTIEESYKYYKIRLQLENFSGKSCTAIEQDFYAMVLVSNAHTLLALEAREELKYENQNKTKYEYYINKNVSTEMLKNEFVLILLDLQACIETFCKTVKSIMKENLLPKRPGRSFPRIRKHPHRKYHMNLR